MKVTTDACLFGAWCANDLSTGEKQKKVLDIGTGTGLLALMAAQKNNFCIDGVEIEEAAAQQAMENVHASPWKKNINIFHTDITHFTGKHYDVVISNPPFYENELKSGNQQKDTAHHSAQLKLETLLKCIKGKLNEDGAGYLLLPFKRKTAAEKLLQQQEFYIQKSVMVKASLLHPPFRWMVKVARQPQPLTEETISIWDEQQRYTPEFTTLLQDYYLYL